VTAVPRSPAALLVAVTAALALAGCSGGGPARQAVFRSQSGLNVDAAARSCQLHQTDAPTSAYRGGPKSDPALELPFLAYFTANGDKPYCDGKPPTATDRAWAHLYVQLTGNTGAVRRILSG
jgi:hypothetical protein